MGNVCASSTTDEKPEVVDSKSSAEPAVPLKEEPATPLTAEPEPEAKAIVTVVGARGLRSSDWLPGTGKPDCYVEMRSKGELLHTTAVISNTCEPVWAEEKPLMEFEGGAPLEFSVYDKDLIGSDFLGRATLEAKDYASEGFNGEVQLRDAKAPQAYLKVKVMMPGKDLPPGPPAEYTVTIERAKKESYGLRLDKQDPRRLVVFGISDGPFSKHNADVKPQEQVKVNDFLVAVNSANDTAAMLSEFGSSLKVECKFKRGVPVSVVFDRGDDSAPLGLEMAEKPGSMTSVLVRSFGGGAAARHNEAAREHEKINAGDRILALGATRGKAEDIKRAMESAKGQLQLTLLKPAVSRSHEGDTYTWGHWLFG
eukprot:CAMPEP_0204610238 /NCGR_PEP_ID=MMETSP0661-20131031/61401_1 /ASSEMBLY_ACC=CAM_ASM_000606 /TAXON_ID=109239 /ORGANISM="Alexandrium margalefi, Strain AMGDE01CS-322" /LENGTH=367 /DNA_ID=CAMNT_0051622043 /DNA_START=67 /DNA_END=1170 /DNA_ORIENTATION=-